MATGTMTDDLSRSAQNTTALQSSSSTRITQFVAPTSCASLFELSGTETITVFTNPAVIFTSDEADLKFSSCKPPGLDQHNGTLSPGVCPSGWIYHSMTAIVPLTNAYCCAESFNHTREKCASTTLGANGTPTIYKHTPITVQWQPTDTNFFPFTVPKLFNGNYIDVWIPGETHDPNAFIPVTSEYVCEQFCPSTAQLVCLGLFPPLFFVLAVGACITCCVKSSRKKKRKRMAMEAELRELREFRDSVVAQAENNTDSKL